MRIAVAVAVVLAAAAALLLARPDGACDWARLDDAALAHAVLHIDAEAPPPCVRADAALVAARALVECLRAARSPPLLPPAARPDGEAESPLRTLLMRIAHAFAAPDDDAMDADVVVVGAGPVGLLMALQARAAGVRSVTVLERRTAYTRDAWVDVSANLWYDGLTRLERWGVTLFEADQHPFSAASVVYRINMLEHTLARLAFLVGGIDVRCGVTPLRLQHAADARSTVVFGAARGPEHAAAFDVLVGCEGGAGTWVREHAGLTAVRHDTAHFDTPRGPVDVRIPSMNQPTMIVRYLADPATGQCPELRKGGDLDPYDIAFTHPNITAAFKRWYRGHCQLQLILQHDYGRDLLAQKEDAQARDRERWQDAGLPWEALRTVTNALLSQPVADIAQLRRLLRTRSRGADELDVDIVPVRIVTTSPLARALPGGRSLVLVFGDNAVTAHYRLGIGINQALLTLTELQTVLAQLQRDGVGAVVVEQQTRAQQRVDAMAHYQLRTIVLEAYCGFVLGVDFAQADLWQAQRVFRAVQARASFDELGRAAGGRWGDVVLSCLRRVNTTLSA